MLGEKTLLQYIIDDEKQAFINENKITYNKIDHRLDLTSGAFLYEVNSTSQAFKDLLSNEHLNRTAGYSTMDPMPYMTQLGTRLIKVDVKKSVEELLQDIYEVSEKLGSSFAGVLLLINGKGIINPLHPLLALELLNHTDLYVNKLLVFTYDKVENIDALYNTAPEHDYTADINLLVKAYQSQIQTRAIKITSNDFNEQNNSVRQKYQISKLPGEDDTKEYFMVAHQLLTRGTFVPFYGTSIVAMNGNTTGIHITPFKSCNISNHNSIGGASVCTGSTSNKTIEGLRTLHHANLGSPYQFNCMTNASKPYADACITYAFNIFKQAKLIKEESENEEIVQEQTPDTEDTSA